LRCRHRGRRSRRLLQVINCFIRATGRGVGAPARVPSGTSHNGVIGGQ
jgi:hypothetical protein